jgi:hypothetical protein
VSLPWLHGGFRPEQQVETRLAEPMDRPRTRRPQVIQTQASIISCIGDFKLMMISLCAIPLVLLLRRAASEANSDDAMVME